MTIHTKNKVVAIGGGHGLGRILAALKDFGHNATGIVATTDNGGSTGRIRQCQGGIAWGDTRNCINQLITEPTTSSMMFEYRFRGAGELNGHNLGNLMLTALGNLSIRPLEAINLIRDMLQVEVNIVPMSEHPADLTALSVSDQWVRGETNVDEMSELLQRLYVEPEVPATDEGIHAIQAADCIILGPGSFLTSIMPPLLLPEIGKAIAECSQAKVVFIDNLDNEYGPAGMMTLEQKLNWCQRACGGRQVDILLGENFSDELKLQYQCVEVNLASPNHEWRHDRKKLQQQIEKIILQ
ncbi:uridine diphosphate-N-acetylglucosamine-binding protein YvcK [Vibrio sp. S11_S32]|uniref:uridine diphosphate-N-acetylglucosamine-binding protein YvcK n=1 Tax=Vibrio sp. S11_S32 TaxID=2720225 RepID=UPI001680BFAD|nr:uridine diphosphate-N-acetylglucosamine-binding protein YvcK [Vibrio sp. S11_S32]MBD1574885.1 uridine diphosphate-N-acetylglucosamine-binding protein YvcK [Vibrio sp. S11_S32]